MKLFCFVMILSLTCFQAKAWSQQERLNLKFNDMNIVEVFEVLQKNTSLKFVFNHENLQQYRVNTNVKNKTLQEILDLICADKPLKYEITKEHVVIFEAQPSQPQAKEATKITGMVVDEIGSALPGVTVIIKGTAIGTATDVEGRFTLQIPPTNTATQLLFSFVGMKTKEEPVVKNKTTYKIVMEAEQQKLEDVVVTGYFERNKTSATGSEVSVKGEELRKVGSLNLLQAISVFDPSVRTIPNNEFGSDPNKVPEISIRGENGFDLRDAADDSRTNPNSPLYIMDGIEVSATTVYDMDMNRIAAFSILKDAAATSLYGSRGANGVIVITTVRPKEGEIKVSVNANFNISVPDLRDYNLMNASEKLEYERLAGIYKSKTSNKEEQMNMDILYNKRLAEVARGVDTYWLSQALRTSVNQRYNAFIEGGDGSFRYGIDLKYSNDKGVMIGSDRQKLGININFNYNIGDNFIIRNDLSVDNVNAGNSPYGSFSTFAQQNPYERIYDPETGEMVRKFTSNNRKNPLLDAEIPNKDIENYTEIRDNLFLDWRINPHFRVNGRFAITKKPSEAEKYRSAATSDFDQETDPNLKGSYMIKNGSDINVDGNVTASYNNTFKDKLILSVGVGGNVTTVNSNSEAYTAVGFLNDNMNYIQFAQQYLKDSKPVGTYDKSRMIGFFGNVNLGWDNRYFIDGSFRTDGSSRFGRNSRFAPFWSVGFAWNVHRENFWGSDGFLKLRASAGSTGTTNFSADQALTRFEYKSDSEYNGIYGAVLSGYGNPSLKWQNTLQYNIGMDLTVWRNIITLNVDAYLKRTENLLLSIDVAPSSGFRSYKENMGSMDNKGIDARLRFNLITDRINDLNWNVTLGVSHNSNKIKKLSNAMKEMNKEALDLDKSAGSSTYRLYEEGRSQSALMVVKSLGIDPTTGNEIYQKLNGELTYDYDPKDKIEVGDINPKVQGNFQTNLNYKGINLYMVFSYEYGAKTYNSTLADKVEGANPLNNADKRVLYDRWKKPGDKAMFRRIDDQTPVYQSTRLVQDNDFLSLSNLSLSYDIPKKILDKSFIERCKFTFSTTDLFRISTIKQERGTSYPFARTFSLGFNATF